MKFLGLGAKAAFILFFAQGLDTGEFTRYFIGFSIAVILSRMLGMGADDELPYRVGGRGTTAGRYLGLSLVYSIVGCFSLALSALSNIFNFEILVFSVSLLLAGNAVAAGALRSIDNFYQEVRLNFPWILMCLFLALLPFKTASHVLYGISISYLLIQIFELWSIRKAEKFSISSHFIAAGLYHSKRIASWLPKALSTAALAASLRAFPLWIGFLNLGANDQLAYAFAIGEVSYQLAMTYVNLLHSSKHLRVASLEQKFSRTVGAFLMLSIVLSGVIYLLLQYIIKNKVGVSFEILIFSSLYSVSIALFSLFRVQLWDAGSAWQQFRVLLFSQSAMFLIPGVMLILFGFSAGQIAIAAVLNMILIFLMSSLKNNSC